MVEVATPDLVYDGRPAVLALGGDETALERARAAVQAAGARAIGADGLGVGDLHAVHARVVLLDIAGVANDGGARALLDAVVRGAGDGRWRAVVAAGLAQVDHVADVLLEPGVDAVLDGSALDLAIALGAATAQAAERTAPMLHERSGRAEEERLRRLTAEVGRIAHTLARISGEPLEPARRSPAAPREPGPSPSAEAVRAMVRARRLRAQFFDGELFADPAWDMLLDLYAARLDQHRVAVSSLCIASAVPATTALRWIKTLTDRGLFVRRADPTDGRRVFIELADGTANAMGAYFAELERMAGGTPWRGGPSAV